MLCQQEIKKRKQKIVNFFVNSKNLLSHQNSSTPMMNILKAKQFLKIQTADSLGHIYCFRIIY